MTSIQNRLILLQSLNEYMTVNKKAIHLVPMFPSEVQHVVDLQQFVSRATFPLSSSDFLLQDNMQLNPQVI